MPEQMTAVERQEDRASDYLLPLWRAIDELPHYPCDTNTVIALADAGGYVVDHNVVREFVRKGYFPAPKRHPQTCQYAWSATHICLFIEALDLRRRWQPHHPLHAHKLWAIEVKDLLAKEAGQNAIPDLDQYSVEDLILMLEQNADQGIRQVICHALRLKLPEHFGPVPEDRSSDPTA